MRKVALALTVSKCVVLTLFAALLAAVATLLGLGMVQADAQTSSAYAVTDLKDLGRLNLKTYGGLNEPPYESSGATGLNEAGQVVGYGQLEYEEQDEPWTELHGFLWKDDGNPDTADMKNIGHLPEEPPEEPPLEHHLTSAHAVNDSGQVVGSSNTNSGGTEAFLYDENATSDKMIRLGKLPGDTGSAAKDINDAGQVVGSSTHSDENLGDIGQAFVYKDSMVDIGTRVEEVFGVNDSSAEAINESGQVAGYAIDPATRYSGSEGAPNYKAFLYNTSNSSVTDLGKLDESSLGAKPHDINASGEVIGSSYYLGDGDDNPSKAFLYNTSNSSVTDLGKLDENSTRSMRVHKINDSGQIVADAVGNDGEIRPALYDGGKWTDLNSLSLPADKSGWRLYDAKAVSNKDSQNQVQIVGTASMVDADGKNGRTHAYLMTLELGSSGSTPPPTDSAEGTVQVGETVSTGNTASETDPVATSVTSPLAGTVTIEETTTDQPSTFGYEFFGQQVNITVPSPSTPENPYKLVFVIDSSLTQGETHETLQIFRNGARVPECTGASGTASPDPCVSLRETVEGDIKLTVLTSNASKWNFGKKESGNNQELYDSYKGFFSPVNNAPTLNTVKAGSAVPVKFSLGGDKGLNIFAPDYPKSKAIDCDSQTSADAIEQTVEERSSKLTYDATTGQYNYVWKTEKTWTGCRQLVLKLADGSLHRANFQFTK